MASFSTRGSGGKSVSKNIPIRFFIGVQINTFGH
jgi:hypothetical protein